MTKLQSSLDLWKKKLLDTTKRNRSINFKPTKASTLQIIHPTVDEFFELMEDKEVQFADLFEDEDEESEPLESDLFSVTEETDEEIEYVYPQGIQLEKKATYSKVELSPVISKFLSSLKKSNKTTYIFSDSSRQKQHDALYNIFKKSRLFMEENAINILHVAVGFLNWYESSSSKVIIKSPLFLMPVELHQDQFDAPFKMTFHETEILLNTSLIKMMESDFKMDMNFEIDTEQDYMTNYLQYKSFLMKKFTDKRWMIEDDVFIGVFSFSKINMVKDIEEHKQQLLANPMIQLLAGETQTFEDDGEIYTEDQLDSLITPQSFYQALDADSSQELAIQAAISGKSFVLQGPPGTGKSQTITNIISELISRGKRVLFVAEKKAALDVVYQNLKKVNLSEYALPLHNTDVDKKTIILELSKSLHDRQTIKELSSDRLASLSSQFMNSRFSLSQYAEALIEKRLPLHLNMYELFGEYYRYTDAIDVKFNILNLRQLNREKLNILEVAIHEFERVFKTLRYDLELSPWYGLNAIVMGLVEVEALESLLSSVEKASKTLIDDLPKYQPYFKIDDHLTVQKLQIHIKLFEHLVTLPYTVNDLIDSYENKSYLQKAQQDLDRYKEYMKLLIEHKKMTDELNKHYDKEVYAIDIQKLFRVFRLKSGLFDRIFSSEYRKAAKMIKLYQKSPRKKHTLLMKDITQLKTVADHLVSMETLHQQMIFKAFLTPDIQKISENIHVLEWYQQWYRLINMHETHPNQPTQVMFSSIIKNRHLIMTQTEAIKTKCQHVEILMLKLQGYFNQKQLDFSKCTILENHDYAQKHQSQLNGIHDYVAYNVAYQRGRDYQIESFYVALMEGKYQSNYFQIFMKRFLLTLIDSIRSEDTILNQFSRDIYDTRHQDFKRADQEMIALAKYRIDTLIAKNTPSIDGLEGMNHEVQTLRREAQKSRKIMPIRKLFEAIPDLIMTLKPCLMMSPLSVSSYLRSTGYQFDAVLFDEASQVRPESSLGAIYRSKQVIIVGDKEQLPPTSFFESVEEDSESEMDADSFDSILDLASGVLKPVSLKWHYRSKFEELIQTSNREIYKDLITFPSQAKPKEREGVNYVKVDGVYVERQNPIEAQKVSELVFEHYKQFGDSRTLGVVTFSETQQKAVERAIHKLRKEHPEMEPFFNLSKQEPFFIKNIETVQGDERDTIIISIGYGPDPTTKQISMNFGPLNKDGGYRRLNVAITRAKYNVILVSSIKDNDIDLNRTEARGMRLLKKYLTFAEHGLDPKQDRLDYTASVDSPFEADVASEIERMSYDVHLQVGSSGYKIDLAVVHPKISSSYIMGVECDGALYHSSKSARDRDRLRQEVLEHRGWIIYRIWSTDWFKHRDREIGRLKLAIENALTNFNTQKNNKYEQPQVEINITKKTSREADFKEYPNYQQLYTKHAHEYVIYALENILINLSPIHMKEVQKLVPPFYGRQKYTEKFDEEFTNDLKYKIIKRGSIKRVGDYLVATHQSITFRKTTESSTRRDLAHIHIDELTSGMIELLKIAECIKIDDFISRFAEYCGYKKVSEDLRNQIMNVIRKLERQKMIVISDNLIEYAK